MFIQGLIIVACICLSFAAIQPFTNVGSTTSAVAVLYSNPNPIIPDINNQNHFVITYANAKLTSHKLLASLSGYQHHGTMIASSISISITNSTLINFNINLKSGGSGSIYYLSVAYISIQDNHHAFYVVWLSFNTLNTVSTGSGQRSQTKSSNFYDLTNNQLNSNLSLNFAAVFISGYELQSSSTFNITLSTSLQNQITFYTTISTDLDCKIIILKAVYLFADLAKNQLLYIYGIGIIFGSGVTVTPVPLHFSSFGAKVLGLRTWTGNGITGSSIASFKYALADQNLVLQSSSSLPQSFIFSYIFVALKGCNPSYPFMTPQNTCTTSCQDHQTQSPTSNKCEICIHPCRTCSTTPKICTSCVIGFTINSLGSCYRNVEEKQNSSNNQLYLLALLAIIPVAIVCKF